MSFADDVRAFADKTNAKLETAIRKIALDLFTSVILMSPVDEGRFRGNWQVAINNVPSGTVETLDPSGQAAIARVQASVQNFQSGQVIYLVNNLPYARRLEYGWSKQAPNGMVRLTEQRFRPIVDAVIRELNT